jgi:glutathione synthase/RimK-type ligase-like ATP-grasp enzyme
MRYRVLPYKQGSKSAKALSEALGGKVLLLEGSRFIPRAGDKVINWGNTDNHPVYQVVGDTVSNHFGIVRRASNKLLFFQAMRESGHDDIIPEYWTQYEHIPDDAFPIVCRQTLAGHSGAGIVIADTRDDLVPAPLYTQYIKKEHEYRIHIGKRGEDYVTIAAQRKARNLSVPDESVNWRVRSHANGFVYVREGVDPPAAAFQAARDALGATGLDFGAVDVIWNSQKERAYVLEINTAPGLEGQTIEDYASFFRESA